MLLISMVAMYGCAGKKAVSDTGRPVMSKPSVTSAEALMTQLHSTQVPFTWFTGQGQGKITWEGEKMSARFHVRIRRDSLIWVQITKLGFEVGRMLVTPDSAFFINRLERTYGKYRTEEFLREYKVPADFKMFSLVFTAGAYLPTPAQLPRQEPDGSIVLSDGRGMTARYWFDATALLSKSLIKDALAREWFAGFSDYNRVNSGHYFPFQRSNTLIIEGETNLFDLEYQSMEIDVPQSFPFSIPSHYEKI
jgi:hypothetical protein